MTAINATLLVLLLIAVATAAALWRRGQLTVRESVARHRVSTTPATPPGPGLHCEVQQYDGALSDRWTEADDGRWIRRVDAQWVLVDTYPTVDAADQRMVELVNEAGDPGLYRVVVTVATDRTAGVRAMTEAAMRAGVRSEREEVLMPVSAAAPEVSLYEQIGGEVTLSAVIKGFYRRVQADGRVSRRFADIDMNRLVQHQARAFTILTGGPNPRGMSVDDLHEWVRQAHSELGVNDDEFDVIARHLVDELIEDGAEGFVPQLGAAFESFRGDVVTVQAPV